jgi:SOS-response transcriptional repressor LexA
MSITRFEKIAPRDQSQIVSLTEIEEAVKSLSPQELAKLAAYIARQDKLSWDEQLEKDFSPGGKHAPVSEKIDAEIDAGNFPSHAVRFPCARFVLAVLRCSA